MSALAAIFRRDRVPVPRERLVALTDRLAHRGRDGTDLLVERGLGVAHRHAWVTPEETGERQPLRSGDLILAFDGRIDNRDELLTDLALTRIGPSLSDAKLLLRAYAAWGEGLCRRLVGPFAFALFDLRRGEGLLARDALGDRTLFYADLGTEVVISSEEASILGHPGVSPDLDEATLVRYFAVEAPKPGSTFFRNIRELEPGKLLKLDERSSAVAAFWSPPEPGSATGPGRGAEFAERYLELLAQAVESRLRSPAPAAVLMSGGLDSTSIAALAAESMSWQVGGRPRAISWVFDALTECDERAFIRPVVEACRLEAREFGADELGPLPDGSELCMNPSTPEESPYRRLKNRAYAEAVRAGSIVLLSGGSADALYTGYQDWFADLVRVGRPGIAVAELATDLWRSGLLTGLRRAGLARWLRPVKPRRRPASWLTHWAAGRLDPASIPDTLGAARTAAAVGPWAARSISVEVSYSARYGVDLRHPYRDRRLVEFMLSLPAHELYRHGRMKAVARRALEGRLPEAVRTRTEPTRLTPLLEQALRGPQRDAWARLLADKSAIWPRYVRAEWIEGALRRSTGQRGDVALWNCLAFELWQRRFDR